MTTDLRVVLAPDVADLQHPTIRELDASEDFLYAFDENGLIDNEAKALVGTKGILVIRRNQPTTDPWSSGQPVECYPTWFGWSPRSRWRRLLLRLRGRRPTIVASVVAQPCLKAMVA